MGSFQKINLGIFAIYEFGDIILRIVIYDIDFEFTGGVRFEDGSDAIFKIVLLVNIDDRDGEIH